MGTLNTISFTPEVNKWYHLTFSWVYNVESVSIFIDDAETQLDLPIQGYPLEITSIIVCGCDESGFYGKMSNLFLYNRAYNYTSISSIQSSLQNDIPYHLIEKPELVAVYD